MRSDGNMKRQTTALLHSGHPATVEDIIRRAHSSSSDVEGVNSVSEEDVSNCSDMEKNDVALKLPESQSCIASNAVAESEDLFIPKPKGAIWENISRSHLKD